MFACSHEHVDVCIGDSEWLRMWMKVHAHKHAFERACVRLHICAWISVSVCVIMSFHLRSYLCDCVRAVVPMCVREWVCVCVCQFQLQCMRAWIHFSFGEHGLVFTKNSMLIVTEEERAGSQEGLKKLQSLVTVVWIHIHWHATLQC
jgi:hypothetical protein